MPLATVVLLIYVPVLPEDIRVDLTRRDDPHVVYRLDDAGFTIGVDVDGYLQKMEPTTIRIDTQQKGRWENAHVESGRYLKTDFDANKPESIRIETTLKFDLGAGE